MKNDRRSDVSHIEVSSLIPAKQEKVFEVISDYSLLPSFLDDRIQLKAKQKPLLAREGAEYEFEAQFAGLSLPWCVRLDEFVPPHKIVERMTLGFLKSWENTYQVIAHDEESARLVNIVNYETSFGLIGQLADDFGVRTLLEKSIGRAHEKVKQYFET